MFTPMWDILFSLAFDGHLQTCWLPLGSAVFWWITSLQCHIYLGVTINTQHALMSQSCSGICFHGLGEWLKLQPLHSCSQHRTKTGWRCLWTNCPIRKVPWSGHMTFLLIFHHPQLKSHRHTKLRREDVFTLMARCPTIKGTLMEDRENSFGSGNFCQSYFQVTEF